VGLTLEAVDGIVGQLLPTELQRALDVSGCSIRAAGRP
jgi:hypothetical protein